MICWILLLGGFLLGCFSCAKFRARSQPPIIEKIHKSSSLLEDLSVKHVFRHHSMVEWIDISWTNDKIIQVVRESKFSRFPVIEGSFDNPVGILLAKDFLKAYLTSTQIDVRSLLKKPFFIHLDQPLMKCLQKILASRAHMCFVIDDYGCVDGIVTLEDILEKIVGEIYDESDKVLEEGISQTQEGLLEVTNKAMLADVFVKLGLNPPENLDPITFWHWVEDRFGREIQEGEEIQINPEEADTPFARLPTLKIKKVCRDKLQVEVS